MARGDQIYVIRPFFNLDGIYEHHGIDCDDGTVIHYSKRDEDATVRRTHLQEFTQGRTIYTREYATCFIGETTVQRAESRLGEKEYNLLYNNCEHFATWCKTGISHSKQIREFAPLLTNLNPEQLYQPIRRSIADGHQKEAPQLFDNALAEVKVAWDDLQPQYNRAVTEMKAWDKVAREAVRLHRDDLARAALYRKREYKQKATDLKQHLDRLAQMTEMLVNKREDLVQ
ncbi:MAG: lecithin retinol acyltransferase family protein [Cyanobacteria bacterium SID2]|nr:lecithin retinol acyltransferase family protein [Cyanobacteria bacterium SID2]MBP0006434.1 lecithin retinol acyltransferase family protein [Cyanobacteria bacterium SBC]